MVSSILWHHIVLFQWKAEILRSMQCVCRDPWVKYILVAFYRNTLTPCLSETCMYRSPHVD